MSNSPDLIGPIDRPLTQREWDAANNIMRAMRRKLEVTCQEAADERGAATRFAKELADLRILFDNLKTERDEALTEAWEYEKHIDFLRDGLREIGYLTDSATIREMAESYLKGDEPPT